MVNARIKVTPMRALVSFFPTLIGCIPVEKVLQAEHLNGVN